MRECDHKGEGGCDDEGVRRNLRGREEEEVVMGKGGG